MAGISLLALMAGLLLEVHGLAVGITEKETGKQQKMVSAGKSSETTGRVNDQA